MHPTLPTPLQQSSGLWAFLGGLAAACIAFVLLSGFGLLIGTGPLAEVLHAGVLLEEDGVGLLLATWVCGIGLLGLSGQGRSVASRGVARLVAVLQEGILFILGWGLAIGLVGGAFVWIVTGEVEQIGDAATVAIFAATVGAVMIWLMPNLYGEIGTLVSSWWGRLIWLAGSFAVAMWILAMLVR